MTEFEFDSSVARMLDRYTWPLERRSDWQDVLRRAGLIKPRQKRRIVLLAAAVVVLLTLALATPLGGAIRRSVSDFSDWLAGTPGTPVSAEEQQAFDEANEKSWASFPGSPQLRRLDRTEVDGVAYDLLGFRSAGATLHSSRGFGRGRRRDAHVRARRRAPPRRWTCPGAARRLAGRSRRQDRNDRLRHVSLGSRAGDSRYRRRRRGQRRAG